MHIVYIFRIIYFWHVLPVTLNQIWSIWISITTLVDDVWQFSCVLLTNTANLRLGQKICQHFDFIEDLLIARRKRLEKLF